MNKKFLIVLLATVFYNGVTYSAPTVETTTDLISKKKQVASVADSDQVNHKVEPVQPAPQNVTHLVEPIAPKNSTSHLEGDGKSKPGNATIADKKIISQDSNNKTNHLNTSTEAVVANVSVNTSSPVPPSRNTSDLAPGTVTEMPRPIPSEQKTTAATTPENGKPTKAPVNKSTSVTPTTPVPTSTETVSVEHNSDLKAEGKGFDGASFVGGIVLTIGLTAIGFIAFKYYKSGKMDGHYRTL